MPEKPINPEIMEESDSNEIFRRPRPGVYIPIKPINKLFQELHGHGYTYAVRGRLISVPAAVDEKGRPTVKYYWDENGRIVQIVNIAYEYDANNLERRLISSMERFIYDSDGRLVEFVTDTYDKEKNVNTNIRELYIYAKNKPPEQYTCVRISNDGAEVTVERYGDRIRNGEPGTD